MTLQISNWQGERVITYEYDVYGYDALGRLSQIQKDGELQTRYGYDAFGNRVLKEDHAGRTTYCHNALNQLITELREEGSAETALRKAYQYDKRGNLTRIMENGRVTQQYVYGALNRLEEACSRRCNTFHYYLRPKYKVAERRFL